MDLFFGAAATAFAVVFLAELGDKSQLLVLAQAARRPAWRVLVEAVAAFALLTALAVTVGALLADWVPAFLLAVASGLLFLAFGVLAMREAGREAPPEDQAPGMRIGGTFALLIVAEMGDKTQLATVALAASSGHAWATGLGSWAAESACAAVAVFVGAGLKDRIDPRRRAAWSALLFFVVGIATLGYAVWTQVELP